MDDGELLKRYVAAGSEEAFRLLVERNLPLVYSAALRKTNNRSMAEDVTQVVFIILRKRRMSFFKKGPSWPDGFTAAPSKAAGPNRRERAQGTLSDAFSPGFEVREPTARRSRKPAIIGASYEESCAERNGIHVD